MAMPYDAKPDDEPRRHGISRRRYRKRRGREFVCTGCSNAGFFVFPPQSRRSRKIPPKVQFPVFTKSASMDTTQITGSAINRATRVKEGHRSRVGESDIRRSQLTGSASGNLHAHRVVP